MEWQHLLSKSRFTSSGELYASDIERARLPFEMDWDRILFSGAFRRMHDKTQVFPLPEDDVTHSRLTHSLEVASVGRQLGRWIGGELHGRKTIDVNPDEIAALVATGCLAHDIGNPPFGHAGEDAIGSFFRSEKGMAALSGLSSAEILDLQHFEGNAQGFRILTRTQLEPDGGLRLCAATLGVFMKYPRGADKRLKDDKIAATKKHGFNQAERAIFRRVAEELQLKPIQSGESWHRHPLALLVEAADDICYSILDIEDGVRLGHVPSKEAIDALKAVASKHRRYRDSRCGKYSPKELIGYLRALSIGQLMEECAKEFLTREEQVLQGEFTQSLVDVIPSASERKALVRLAKSHCYNAPSVIEIEMAGYEALGGLLSRFVSAVVSPAGDWPDLPQQQRSILMLLKQRNDKISEGSAYERLLRVTDFVSGMTDRHALTTYRKLSGISVPGRIG